MHSTKELTPKKKKTALEMAKDNNLTVDEYIQRYGYPFCIKYKGNRDDN